MRKQEKHYISANLEGLKIDYGRWTIDNGLWTMDDSLRRGRGQGQPQAAEREALTAKAAPVVAFLKLRQGKISRLLPAPGLKKRGVPLIEI